MLYDPKWEVKADPFTLDALISWLETQPADRSYPYSSARKCLLCQYFEAHGFRVVQMGSSSFYHGPRTARVELPEHFDEVACHWRDQTCGGALRRARAYQRSL